jgi:integrase
MALGLPLASQYRSPYLRDFIELALNTGCRKQELLGLEWRNVDFDNNLILLEKTKNGTRRSVHLNSICRAVLIRRMGVRAELCPDTPWVFFHGTPVTHVNVGGRVKNVKTPFATACKKAGIDDVHIHDLRHTATSWLVMEGVPLLEVSRLLGHKSITQTERYAHLTPESTRTLAQILEGNAGESSALWPTWMMKKTVELPEPVTTSES